VLFGGWWLKSAAGRAFRQPTIVLFNLMQQSIVDLYLHVFMLILARNITYTELFYSIFFSMLTSKPKVCPQIIDRLTYL
jgi:hypothetical protein